MVKRAVQSLLNYLPDEAYLKLKYRVRMGKKLSLENPQTFAEKLQWLKLHNRKPEYTTMVDKAAAKDYVAEKIGREYIIPTLGLWDRFEDIDFDALPNQFVLKCTHDSGGLVICRDKATLDKEAARKKIEKSLKNNYFYHGREWPYKDVKPRIIAEAYLEDTADDALTDYKFFCFHGEAKLMYVSKDAGVDPRTDFFDMEFNHLELRAKDPNADVLPEKPACFEEMRSIAEILSKDIPHLRVDFYFVQNRIYIGEMTFYHNSGFVNLTPDHWNERLGSWITLPEI